jgi:hypothetical protein
LNRRSNCFDNNIKSEFQHCKFHNFGESHDSRLFMDIVTNPLSFYNVDQNVNLASTNNNSDCNS